MTGKMKQNSIVNVLLLIVMGVLLLASRKLTNEGFSPALALLLFSGFWAAGKGRALLIPAAFWLIADYKLGFYPSMAFQYAALMGCLALGWSLKAKKQQGRLPYGAAALAAIVAPFGFFVISNLGVWALDPLYPRTAQGLMDCYLMAFPFYKTMAASTLVGTLVLTTVHNLVFVSNPHWIAERG